MPSLGNLWYTLGIKDLTDADLKKINAKLKDLGSEIQITPKFVKSLTEILPKEVPIKLNPKLKPLSNEAIERAVQTNVIKAAQAELNRLKTAQTEAADAAKTHGEAARSLGNSFLSLSGPINELKSMLTNLWSIQAAKEFLSQVIEVGGELEHQKIAMDTIFGDKGKTTELFGQIKGLARQSPFGVMELTKSVKALSAYGVEYNEIYDTAKRLADISAATSVDINRLILAFGKTKSRTFLDGLEAKQFAYANIPIYDLLSKKLTELEGHFVSIGEVMERQKKRQISFDIVKDVLWDITDPGGKFYDMQEALAGSVKTSWKLVRDNIELMLGEIAESSVGGALKDVAETLQVLTRNWRTLGTVIGSAALSFGVYKVTVAASNAMMGQANALALQKATTSNKVAAANAMEAASYRALTTTENYSILAKSGLAKLNRSLLLSHRALTEAEWDAVLASKAVNSDYILRRIALGKLTQEEIEYLVSIKAVTTAEVQRAASAANLRISLASLYAMMKIGAASAWASTLNFFKRFKDGMTGLWTSVKTFKPASFFTWIKTLPSRLAHAEVGVTRLKLAFSSLGRAMSSIGAFLLNPVTITMAAIGGLMYAWEKNNEQMEKAKEIGDNIFTKATEGASNLEQTLNGIKPSAGLSDHELTQGIEQMEQAIKDYSPRPLQDINDTLVAQDGHVLTLAEQYDALKKKVEGVAEVYKIMGDLEKGDVGTMVSDAIKSTGGLLNDTVSVNAKDYTKALKRRSDAIREAAKEDARWINQVVDEAIKADGEFAKAAAGLENIAAKWNELASNPEKYKAEYKLPAVQAAMNAAGITDINRGITEDRKKFESDVQAFIKDLTASIRITWDKEIEDLNNSQKDALAISLKNMLDQAEGVSEEVKMQWAQALENAFGVTIIEDKIGPALKGSFVSAINGATDASIIAVVDKWKNEGWEALSDTEQQIVWNMMQDAKEQTMVMLGTTQKEMQDYLSEHPLSQTIQLAYSDIKTTEYQQEVWKSSPKLAGLLSDAIPVPVIDAGKLTDKAKKQKTWYDEWTRDSKGDYETKNRIKSDLEALHNEILASKNRSAEYREMKQEEFDAKMELAEAMGLADIELKALKSNKHGKDSQKDPLAESLRQRFKDIKDAYSMYKEWAKMEGKEAAFKRVGESGLFATLDPDKVPQTVDEYLALIDELEKELKAAGVEGKSQRENLARDLIKERFGINKDTFKEQLQLALDKVSKEAERQLADWNLFDKIRKATGNQDLAMSIAFGMNVKGETDYPALVKKQFDKEYEVIKEKSPDLPDMTFDNMTLEKAQELGDDVVKIYEDATKKLQQYAREQKDAIADILNEYQSLQDKLTKIDADRDRKIKTVQESDMSAPDKAKYTQRINVKADYQKFTQSADYLKFFSGIYSLTMQQAQEIGDKIRMYLDQQLQDAQISAEDYYKEIERINQQLTKLRNVKSDAMTFLTGGMKGLNEKQMEVNDSRRLKTTQDIAELENKLQKARETGDKHQEVLLMAQLRGAREELSLQDKIRDKIIQNQQLWQNFLDVANITANIAGGLSDAFNSIRDMADALGVDTESGAWGDIAAVMDTLTAVTGGVQKVVQSAMSGDIGGILSGAVSTITTPFTIWAQLHDKKLQTMIEHSREYSQQLQYINDAIERRMQNYLGNAKYMRVEQAEEDMRRLEELNKRASQNRFVAAVTRSERNKLSQRGEAYKEGGAYGYQRQLMTEQLAELEKQRQAELDKKKTDSSVVADYENQIDEMKVQIQQFAEEAANALYGIDLNGWAEQLGDSLVDAFSKGEDAAEAFDKTVGDIMRDMTSKMISQDILAPMFGDLRNYLFGENGTSGAFGADFELSPEEAVKMKEYIDRIKTKGIPAAQELYDAINDATGGILDDTDKSKSALTAGIQAITENTADLLASYVNGIRGDVAMQTHELWPRLLDDVLPQISIIAQSQLNAQRQIAENTLRTAVATELLVQLNTSMEGSWRRIAMKEWGYY